MVFGCHLGGRIIINSSLYLFSRRYYFWYRFFGLYAFGITKFWPIYRSFFWRCFFFKIVQMYYLLLINISSILLVLKHRIIDHSMKKLLTITCILMLLFVNRSSSRDNARTGEILATSFPVMFDHVHETDRISPPDQPDKQMPSADICIFKQCDLKNHNWTLQYSGV